MLSFFRRAALLCVALIAAPWVGAQTPLVTVSSGGADGRSNSWMNVPFTVVNTTGQPQTAWLGRTCSQSIWDQWDFEYDPNDYGECLAEASIISLGPHESRVVNVALWTGSLAAGTVTLTASAGSSTSTGSATLFIPRRPRVTDVVFSVKGATLSAQPNSYYTMYFTVSDTAARPLVTYLALDCGPFTFPGSTWCGWVNERGTIFDNKAWYELDLDPGPSGVTDGQVTIWTGEPGTHGYLRMVARMPDPNTGVMQYDTIPVLVRSGDQLMPAVTPKGGMLNVAPRITRTDSFTVINTGLVAANYTFVPACGAFTGGGCEANPKNQTLAAGASVRVGVSYLPSATNGAQTAIKLVATGSIAGVAPQADSGSVTVTAIDALAPTITVAPAPNATTTTQQLAVTVSLCDDGLVSNPTVTFNGVLLPDMFLRVPQAGCMSAGTSAYSVTAQPGTNTIRVIAGDGYHIDTLTRMFVYDDAIQVAPQVSPLFAANPRVPMSTAWTDTFTVKNPGPVAASYSFAASCGGFGGCVVQPASSTIVAGNTLKVVVGYTSANTAGQSATIQLTASHTSATSHTVSASASVVAITAGGALTRITMTPEDGAAYSSPSFSPTIVWCDPDDAIASHDVYLGGMLLPGSYRDTTISGCSRAGVSNWTNVPLQPWDQPLTAIAKDAAGHTSGVTHAVRYVPSLAAFAPRVTPKATALQVIAGVVNGQTFAVTNAGAYGASYEIGATCGVFTVCRVDKSSLTLAPGQRDSARVTFLAPSPIGVFSPIQLIARYAGPGTTIADTGEVTAHTPTAAELYQPKVAGSPFPFAVPPSSPIVIDFAIQNLGTRAVSYFLVATTTGGVVLPSGQGPPQSVVVAPGGIERIALVPRAPAAPATTGSVMLTAFYTASDNTVVQSSGIVAIATNSAGAGVVLSPHDASVTVARDSSIHQHRIVLKNPGAVAVNDSVIVRCVGLPIACPSPFVRTVPASDSVVLQIAYRVGSLSSGTLVVIARATTNAGILDSAVVHLSYPTAAVRAVSIKPDSLSRTVPTDSTGQQTFEIENQGGTDAVYRYTTTCENAGPVFISCSTVTNGLTAIISSGHKAVIAVSFRSVAIGGRSGKLRVVATDTADASVTTTGVVSISTAAAVSVDVQTVGASTTTARDQCLTIAAGEDAAYECGSLRLVHAMPSTTTLGRVRTPTLVYDSRQQSGFVLFPANVSVTAPNVTNITAKVVLPDGVPTSQTFSWRPEWSNGAPRRIVVAVNARAKSMSTGAYRYTLSVDAQSGTSTYSNQDTGTVAVVNRSASQFSPGWWLDGQEQLVAFASGSDTTRKLWVSGDGSTRLYTRVADTIWVVSPSVDRPDTLTSNAARTRFARHLRNGAVVQFDSLGRHATTVSALGHRTTFYYSVSRPWNLDSITLPVPAGSLARPTYVFTHDPVTQLVTRISAPRNGTAWRATDIGYGTAPGWSAVVTSMTNTGENAVLYGYDGVGRVGSRTNRRGFVTRFDYDEGHGLQRSTLFMGAGAASDVVRYFCLAETVSLTGCARGPIDTASVTTRYDGPRNDVADTTYFRVTRYGAPAVITNALGGRTIIERGDSRWPLLATAVVQPNGHRVESTYDTQRGLPTRTIDVGPLGGTTGAVTQYSWHAKWDLVIGVTSPMGVLDTMGYAAGSPRRTWQQRGYDASRRVFFNYDTVYTGLLTSTVAPLVDRDSIEYDRVSGNVIGTRSRAGFWTTVVRDGIGRDSVTLSAVDSTDKSREGAEGRRVKHVTLYDAAGRPVDEKTTGFVNTFPGQTQTLWVVSGYDAEGNLTSLRRVSLPDSAVGSMITLFTYDGENRKTAEESPDHARDSTAYDPSGNVVWHRDRNGDVSTMTYDPLKRLARRAVPGKTFAPEVLGAGGWARFPLRPIGGSAGVSLSPDLSSFTYDAVGNLETAENGDAQITRRYYPNGSLANETQGIRTYVGSDFSRHVFTVGYGYDLDGRRTRTDRDANGDSVHFEYRPGTGELVSVYAARTGALFTYDYDNAARPSVSHAPGGVTETHEYDAGDRLVRRTEIGTNYSRTVGVTDPRVIHADTMSYDAREKIVRNAGPIGYAVYQYSGLGALDYAQRLLLSATVATESYTTDALGNAMQSVAGDQITTNAYQRGTGRLIASATTNIGAFGNLYDAAGNQTHYGRIEPLAHGLMATITRSYYGADGKLRVADRQVTADFREADGHMATGSVGAADAGATPDQLGAFEEYRYDAIGRRVLKRSRRTACEGPCQSAIERYVWDGDNLLMEFRYPGHEGISADSLEVDRGIVVSIDSSRTQDDQPATLRTVYSPYYGSVRYTHAGGIDHPLMVERYEYGQDSTLFAGVAGSLPIVLHYDSRGAVDEGTVLSGRSTLSQSIKVDWPGTNVGAFGSLQFHGVARSWFGGLPDGMRDASGFQYKRNRYYDPASGRFTQEDPIGLAGGMNLYGFAAGDPVNFSDPFGLCPPIEDCLQQMANWGAQKGGAAGSVALNVAAALNSVNDVNPISTAFDAGYDIGSGHVARGVAMATLTLVPGGGEGRLVIGKMAALEAVGAIGAGERTLLPKLAGNLGSAKANWARNSGALRAEMSRGLPIRDGSVNAFTGALEGNTGFLRAERALLQDRGWTFDASTRFWNPPR